MSGSDRSPTMPALTAELLDEITGGWNPPAGYRTKAEVTAWVFGVCAVVALAKRIEQGRLS